ncbi:hypothetical protein SAMN05192574_107147 [Mucilaginibacter gossypiicola]|uniref:HEAT repeat-containing protein n=1 Tax=Mucilaginibacter gossypiicola TaxID=551995 RepID=A0A1H8NY40_9SPHI|nr:hypothetical protein [Mucilaginibacter gossypiicola]SEO34472.1 hypothetical protein SAMN05192574_107147 [Mucilaginibacter gossypiicola]
MKFLLFNLKTAFVFLFALSLLFAGCNETKPVEKTESVPIRPAIQDIVDSVAKFNRLDSSAVGYAGIRTIQWIRYEKLSKTATLPELRALTRHKSAVVRCYAYDALTARKDTAAFTILLAHLQDTAMVSSFIGCVISREQTGVCFLNSVTRYDSTYTGYKLSPKQKSTIDSILLFDKRITLSVKYDLLFHLKPQPQYYTRVREIAVNEKTPVAIWTLSRYKKANDISVIVKAFDNIEAEDYAIRSAASNPDSSFYPMLAEIFEREWNEKSYDYQKWRLLYAALARYPKAPQTLAFFNRTIKTKDEFRYKTLAADLLIAITKYPAPVFEPLKKYIKLDEYSMESVHEALNNAE